MSRAAASSASAGPMPSSSIKPASYPIQLASSVLPSSSKSSSSSNPLVSLKYNFKPPSVGAASLGVLHAPASASSSSTSSASVDWLLELVGDEGATLASKAETSSSAHGFRGPGSASKDVDCVLVWDEESQAYTLCPAPLSILLKYERRHQSLTPRGKQRLDDAKATSKPPKLRRIEATSSAAASGKSALPSSSSSSSDSVSAAVKKDGSIAPPQRRSSRSATKKSRESRGALEDGEAEIIGGLGLTGTHEGPSALQPAVVLKGEEGSRGLSASGDPGDADDNDGWGAMMASQGDGGGYGDTVGGGEDDDDDEAMASPPPSAAPSVDMRRTRSRDEPVPGQASRSHAASSTTGRKPAPLALRAVAEPASETVSTPGKLTDMVLAPATEGSDEDGSPGKRGSNDRTGVSQSPAARYAASLPSVAPTPAIAPTPQLGGPQKGTSYRPERLDSPALSGKATPAISPASVALPGTPGAASGQGFNTGSGVSSHTTWQPPPQRQPAAINYMDDYDDEDDDEEEDEDDDEEDDDDDESDGESSMDLDAFAAQLDEALENPTPMDEHPPSSALGLPSSTSTGSVTSSGAKAQRSSKRASVSGAGGRRSQR